MLDYFKLQEIAKDSPAVLINWNDAGSSNEEGWHSLDELKDSLHQYPVQTTGFLIHCTEEYAYLCSDISNKDQEDTEYHTINSIPVGCITNVSIINKE